VADECNQLIVSNAAPTISAVSNVALSNNRAAGE
jgi:hypothetical protein